MSGWDQQYDIDGLNAVEESWSWRDEVKATILIVAALLVVVVTLFACAELTPKREEAPPPEGSGASLWFPSGITADA